MEPIYFVLAIMGCGDDAFDCRREGVSPVRYESRAACQAAMPAALSGAMTIDYPVVQAVCEQRGMVIAGRAAQKPRG